jgi:hypothetical protein
VLRAKRRRRPSHPLVRPPPSEPLIFAHNCPWRLFTAPSPYRAAILLLASAIINTFGTLGSSGPENLFPHLSLSTLHARARRDTQPHRHISLQKSKAHSNPCSTPRQSKRTYSRRVATGHSSASSLLRDWMVTLASVNRTIQSTSTIS